MSSGPALTGENCMESIKDPWVCITLSREDFCTFKGECDVKRNVTGDLCLWCVHRYPLDIPRMIEMRKRVKKGVE